MRCSCCGCESYHLCQISMTTQNGQIPRNENVVCTARDHNFEICMEIMSCRGVKSPQNSEELQKHSRPRLGGDDHTPCLRKGHCQISPVSFSIGQMNASAAFIILSAARKEGQLEICYNYLKGSQCSLNFFPAVIVFSVPFFF